MLFWSLIAQLVAPYVMDKVFGGGGSGGGGFQAGAPGTSGIVVVRYQI